MIYLYQFKKYFLNFSVFFFDKKDNKVHMINLFKICKITDNQYTFYNLNKEITMSLTKRNQPIEKEKTQWIEATENSTQRELVWVLANLYSKKLEYDQFIKIVKNWKYQKAIIAKYLYWKKYNELSDQEKEEFNNKLKQYEFFQIYWKDWEPLLTNEDLPVLEFRKNCHGKNKFNEGVENYHRASDFIIMNSNNEVLISLRSSDKDTYPNYRELWGGHSDIGESFEETMIREVEEEQGIKKWEYIYQKLWKYIYIDKSQFKHSHHHELFVVNVDYKRKTKHNKQEILETKWVNIKKIRKLIYSKDFKIIPHQKIFLIKLLIMTIKKSLKKENNINKIRQNKKDIIKLNKFKRNLQKKLINENLELHNQEWYV